MFLPSGLRVALWGSFCTFHLLWLLLFSHERAFMERRCDVGTLQQVPRLKLVFVFVWF